MGLFSRFCAGPRGGAPDDGFDPDTRPAGGVLDVEGFGLAHEVAELAVAVGARVKIGKQNLELLADLPQRNPSILAFDLRNRLFQYRDRSAPGLQSARLGGR